MTTYSFLDDYSEGCHPEIVAALADTNLAQQTAYGNDDYSIEAHRLMADECGDPDLPVHFVSGGTLANLIIAAATLRSHEAMISASSGHVAARETGAIEATGHKIITMPSADGKLTAADVEGALAANAQYPHMAKPRLVYVSNATELGTVYTPDELHALRAVCTQNDLLLMIDGARLGVALASERAQGMSLADIAAVADIFWVGGTKAGTLFGEAIVIANPTLATRWPLPPRAIRSFPFCPTPSSRPSRSSSGSTYGRNGPAIDRLCVWSPPGPPTRPRSNGSSTSSCPPERSTSHTLLPHQLDKL